MMMNDFFESGQDMAFEDHRDDSAYIHESSYIDSPCRIGKNTTILHFAHIMPHSIIGDNCHIGHHVTIASGVMIGNNVKVMNNALLNSGVILEDSVYCGASTTFNPLNHLRGKTKSISRISPTLVREGANIGPNSSIAAGVVIGRYSFIEACTVIDRNVPDYAMVMGNPLKLRGWRCVCGELLRFEDETARCRQCGDIYLRSSRYKVTLSGQPDKEAAGPKKNQR